MLLSSLTFVHNTRSTVHRTGFICSMLMETVTVTVTVFITLVERLNARDYTDSNWRTKYKRFPSLYLVTCKKTKLLECNSTVCALFSCMALNSCLNSENVCPHGVKAPQQPHHMLYNTIDFNLYRGGAQEMEREKFGLFVYGVHRLQRVLCASSECQSYRFMFTS